MALSYTSGGSGWILGITTSPKGRLGIGKGCTVRWCSHRPWRCSNHVDVAMRDVVSWHSGDGHGFMVGLDDFSGFLQP